jgi:hypothetical protein
MNPIDTLPPSAGRGDFDFLVGDWTVQHRRLRKRLADCQDWDQFSGTSRLWLVLDGLGTVDDNWLDLPGGAYRALTVRAFDPLARQWSIWWLDGRQPQTLDTPMRGGFGPDGVGRFYADELFEGRPIRVRFVWSDIASDRCRWEQAFSTDGGSSWEVNWVMHFERRSVPRPD